jgi:L-asparaginase
MAIKLFITGGTIDNIHKDKHKFRKTYLPQMLKQSKITLPISVEKLILKDSRELTDDDRELILKKCLACKDGKIIITHGTFTMSETANFLYDKIKNKTIILTGSMIPFIEKNSDALFNLGCAVTAVQTLPNGVYITMNGKIFHGNNVKKNIKHGEFEKLK